MFLMRLWGKFEIDHLVSGVKRLNHMRPLHLLQELRIIEGAYVNLYVEPLWREGIGKDTYIEEEKN